MPQLELKRRVRWADADPAYRINFPKYFEYFEEAETELLRSLGVSYTAHQAEYGFPRVHADCSFKRMLALDMEFTIRICVGKLGRSSIRYDYLVFDDQGELAAEGTMTVVTVKDGKSCEIPEPLRTALAG